MSVQARSFSGIRRVLAVSAATIALAGVASLAPAAQGTAQPFTVEDLLHLKRLGDPQVSPDGRYVAYVLRESDMDANKFRSDIWLLDLTQKEAQPRRLTTDRRMTRARAGLRIATLSISCRAAAAAHRYGAFGSTEARQDELRATLSKSGL